MTEMPGATELQQAFARRLMAARLAKGFDSGRAAAENLGVMENTYTSWERGGKAPKYWHLVLIKRRWGVPLDYLLDGDEAHLPLDLFKKIKEACTSNLALAK